MTSRIRKRCWVFTWNNPPDGAVTQLRDSFEQLGVKYVFQREFKKCEHLQGGIYFNNQVGINFQDSFPKEMHWAFAKKSWRTQKNYCSKVNTRIEGPWTNVENLTWRRTVLSPLHDKVLYDWQQDVMNIVKEYADDRTVHWYWDTDGCTGKSSLAKHLVMRMKCCLMNGCSNDCFCALKFMTDEDDVDIVVFDLSRSQENRISYTAIEGVKNGFFFSGKYESKHVVMNPPHVFVFANFAPDVNKLSLDRWHIVNINGANAC